MTIACVSIVVAVLVTLIDVSVIKPNVGDLQAFRTPSLSEAMTSVLNIVLAYGKTRISVEKACICY